MDFRKSEPFLFWLAGASVNVLRKCPEEEQTKYAALGATVLIPSIFAFVASFYILSTLTSGWFHLIMMTPVAFVWAFAILTIDRALLASYRTYVSWLKKLWQFLLRFLIALFMGIAISHPIVLLVFNDTIGSEIEKNRSKEIASIDDEHEVSKGKIGRAIEELQRDEIAILNEIKAIDRPFFSQDNQERENLLNENAEKFEKDINAVDTQLNLLNTQLNETQTRLDKVKKELEHWEEEYKDEISGKRSPKAGIGPLARSIESNQINTRREEIENLKNRISTLNTQINESNKKRIKIVNEMNQSDSEIRQKYQEGQQRRKENFEKRRDEKVREIESRLDAKKDEIKKKSAELTKLQEEWSKNKERIENQPREDILMRTLILHEIFFEHEKEVVSNSENFVDNRGYFALAVYIVFTVLLVLLDTIPIIVKFFMKPGPYDVKIDQNEFPFECVRVPFRKKYEAQADAIAEKMVNALINTTPAFIAKGKQTPEFLDFLKDIEKRKSDFKEWQLKEEGDADRIKDPKKREIKMKEIHLKREQFDEDIEQQLETFLKKWISNN